MLKDVEKKNKELIEDTLNRYARRFKREQTDTRKKFKKAEAFIRARAKRFNTKKEYNWDDLENRIEAEDPELKNPTFYEIEKKK